ncbi:NUDIX hydrolase [Falsiroseomonas sp. CW058]|uniref:NUDIX hydrolase n=1 Tax=Falsiroseomonas sp. CW058 TaxID=3388664 RepID=UPI003D31EEF4
MTEPAARNRREFPDRPWVGIGVVAFRGDSVLLVRRGRPPRLGEWSLPGGAQRLGEAAEQAARRELREETGIEVGPLRLLAVVDAITPGDDPARPRFHYTIIDYAAAWVAGEPRPGDDVTEAAWTTPADLPRHGLSPEALRVIEEARRLPGFPV